jgi:hypothetical protein
MHDGEFLLRFEREARIVANLDHPNIVPVYDFDEYENQPYLVMKYLDGFTLKEVLREGPLSLEDIQQVMTKVAGALHYAHKMGILHRDMKPANIIIDRNGEPYITDFGLARIVQAGESSLSADVMLGTPNYISPEQAEGNATLDARTDVYSLGVILYELVTGRVPFSGDTPYAIVHKHIYDPPPPPSEIDPEIPPAVEQVLLTALAKDPAARYATPIALMKAFNEAIVSSGITELDEDRAARANESMQLERETEPVYPEDDGRGKYVNVPVALYMTEPEPTSVHEFVQKIGDRLTSIFGDVTKELAQRESVKKIASGVQKTARSVRLTIEENVANEKGSKVLPAVDAKREEKRVKIINADWGADEASIRRRVDDRISQRRGFFAHLLLFIIVVVVVSVRVQPAALEGFQKLYVEPDVIHAFEVQSDGENFLKPLEQIHLGLLLALLWGSLLFNHFLTVIYNSGGRLERRRDTLQRELEMSYGPNWRNVVSVADYKRTRNRIEKRFASRRRLISHLVTVVLLTLIAGHLWTPINESLIMIQTGSPDVADLIDVNMPGLVLLVGMITVLIHGLAIGVLSLFGDDARERAIQRELQRERERSGLYPAPQQPDKRKVDDGATVIEVTPPGSPAVRLTEDGEFTNTFIEELEEKQKRDQ